MADKDPATLEQEASTLRARVSQLERSEAERARSHREELARRDADIAKLKADMARAGGAPVQGSGAGSMPSVAQPKRYCLAKRRWRLGNAGYVQIWEKVPNTDSAAAYNSVPDSIAMYWGGGNYACVDESGKHIGSELTVAGDDPDAMRPPTPQAPAVMPMAPTTPGAPLAPIAPSSIGGQQILTPGGNVVRIPSEYDEALSLLDAAIARGNIQLQQVAIDKIKAAGKSQPQAAGVDAGFNQAIALLTAMNQFQGQIRLAAGITPNPGAGGSLVTLPGGGSIVWPTDPEAQKGLIEWMAGREDQKDSREFWKALAQALPDIADKVAARLAPPKVDAQQLQNAGTRLAAAPPQLPPGHAPAALSPANPNVSYYAPPASSSGRPGAPLPTPQAPATAPAQRPSPAPPPPPSVGAPPAAPPSVGTGAKGQPIHESTMVRCGACNQVMSIDGLLRHTEDAACPAMPGYIQKPGMPAAGFVAPDTSAPPPSTKPVGPVPPVPPAPPAPMPAAPSPPAVPAPVPPPGVISTAPPAVPPAVAGGGDVISVPVLPEGVKQLLSMSDDLVKYINSWAGGNEEHGPEPIADIIWALLALKPNEKKALLEVIEKGGFDPVLVVAQPFIDGIIQWPHSLDADPAKRREQVVAAVQALVSANLLDAMAVPQLSSIDQLDVPIDKLKGYLAIILGDQGRLWLKRFLNQVARKAGLPVPHGDILPKDQKPETL